MLRQRVKEMKTPSSRRQNSQLSKNIMVNSPIKNLCATPVKENTDYIINNEDLIEIRDRVNEDILYEVNMSRHAIVLDKQEISDAPSNETITEEIRNLNKIIGQVKDNQDRNNFNNVKDLLEVLINNRLGSNEKAGEVTEQKINMLHGEIARLSDTQKSRSSDHEKLITN